MFFGDTKNSLLIKIAWLNLKKNVDIGVIKQVDTYSNVYKLLQVALSFQYTC